MYRSAEFARGLHFKLTLLRFDCRRRLKSSRERNAMAAYRCRVTARPSTGTRPLSSTELRNRTSASHAEDVCSTHTAGSN